MNSEIQQIWSEILHDFGSPTIFWQLLVLMAAFGVAWLINGALHAYVMRHAHESAKMTIGSINRVLFPLSALIGIGLGKWLLMGWQHTGLLQLAIKLLLALALIRLSIYSLRYIFDPSGWLKTFERVIAWVVWCILALHVTGELTSVISLLKDIEFPLGKGKANLWMLIQGVFTVIITLIFTLWISRFLENKLMRADHISANMRVVMVKLVRIFFIAIGVLFALSAVGFDITLLSVFGGALGVGLGFGLQKIASNYVSGFIILLDKSMQIGDVVTIENHYGVIAELRSRYMVLRKLDGTEVVIPNEILIANSVINHSYTNRNARVQLPVQISYESDLELAMQLMLDEGKTHRRVKQMPVPEVQVAGFGENGIDLVLNVWITDPEEGSFSLKSAIYLNIWQAFKRNNIVIPYPQREIRILGNPAD